MTLVCNLSNLRLKLFGIELAVKLLGNLVAFEVRTAVVEIA